MIGRYLVLGAWVFGLVNLIVGYPGIWSTIAMGVLILLVVSHTAETLYVLKHIQQAPGSFVRNLISSFVFGHMYNRRYL